MKTTSVDTIQELLELLRKTHEIAYKSTVDLTVEGFKQLGIVHGGAVAGILAFVGAVKERPGWALMAALLSFAAGLLCNLLSMYYARFAQAAQIDVLTNELERARILAHRFQILETPDEPPFGDLKTAMGGLDQADETHRDRAVTRQGESDKLQRRARICAQLSLAAFPVGAALAAYYFACQFRA